MAGAFAAVSFVIPVCNGEPYLAECIDSVLKQTHRPSEVIVVDDGSQDGSAEIANSFGGIVRCVRRVHAGQAAARNYGVAVSHGEFIAFLDADDIASPHRVERQLARFSARPTLEFCDAYAKNFWSPELPEADRRLSPREMHTHGDALKPRLIITWMMRRALFERLGGFDERLRLGEDTRWRDRVDNGDVDRETIEEILAFRRLHNHNLTRRHYESYLAEIVRHTKERMRAARRQHEER